MYVVLPGDVDDAAKPSGGNVYDRRLCDELAALGHPVREIHAAGAWPLPDAGARTALARELDALPGGAVLLLDGLVACGVPDVLVPRAGRLRMSVLVHLPLADETGLDPAIAAELDARERETLGAVRTVVATSAWAARRVAGHHRLDARRVHVVTPGTDPAPLAPGTDGASRLVCVASVTPRKGQDVLVDALARVTDVPWRCDCVGPEGRDSGYPARVRQLVERHDLGDRVRFAGPRTGRQLAGTYAAADLVVLPSRAETYGMVATEALARGIPLLASDVDAVPDTLGRDSRDRVPGILIPPDDAGALADGLRRWFGDPALRANLRGSARARRGMLRAWSGTARRMAEVLELPR